jgi:hypothetical protein
MGKAWSDQFNNTAIAQFLTDERFSSSLLEVGNRPYLVYPIIMKWDRIGQSILHGFFTTSSFSDANTLFEPTIMLSPALIVVAIYGLCRRLGLAKWHALATGVTAGLVSGITMVHLESFLSHALALPLLLFWPVALSELSEHPNWHKLSSAAILLTATTSIYTEFWIVLMGVMLLTLGTTDIRHPCTWRLLGCYGALAASAFTLNPWYAPSILAIVGRVEAPVLHNIYPWAFQLEGLGRIWLGDNVALSPGILQGLIRLYVIATTAMAYYGLISACAAQLSPQKLAWTDLRQRCSLACALSVLMLAFLPIFVIVRDLQHPYQFYKLLLSVSPLLVMGVVTNRQSTSAYYSHCSSAGREQEDSAASDRASSIDTRGRAGAGCLGYNDHGCSNNQPPADRALQRTLFPCARHTPARRSAGSTPGSQALLLSSRCYLEYRLYQCLAHILRAAQSGLAG